MSADFIFMAAGHVAGWLATALDQDGEKVFRIAEDAFRVEGAEPQKQLPAALVYPLSEVPNPNVGGRAATVQTITATFGVLHIVKAPNAPAGRGKGKERTMGAVRASRRTILQRRIVKYKTDDEGNFELDDDGEKILLPESPIPGTKELPVFAGGALEEISNGRIYWLDRYSIQWVLDSQSFNGG